MRKDSFQGEYEEKYQRERKRRKTIDKYKIIVIRMREAKVNKYISKIREGEKDFFLKENEEPNRRKDGKAKRGGEKGRNKTESKKIKEIKKTRE